VRREPDPPGCQRLKWRWVGRGGGRVYCPTHQLNLSPPPPPPSNAFLLPNASPLRDTVCVAWHRGQPALPRRGRASARLRAAALPAGLGLALLVLHRRARAADPDPGEATARGLPAAVPVSAAAHGGHGLSRALPQDRSAGDAVPSQAAHNAVVVAAAARGSSRHACYLRGDRR
jgi:hypothetical protein